MLSKLSVKKPYTVFVAVMLVLVLGVISFLNVTTDLLPSIELPYVLVITSYPGASPEKVEETVTKPLEAALGTTANLVNISSESSENMSMVTMEFEQGINMDSVVIDVSGKIDLVEGAFDDVVGTPSVLKISPDMMPIAVASIDMEGMSMQEVSKYVETEVIPEFERIPGVASVDPSGLLETQVTVTLDPVRIETINNKVLAGVDSELAEAQEELNDAQRELNEGLQEIIDQQAEMESGQSQLQSASGEMSAQLAQASAEIDAAVAQMAALESEKAVLAGNKIAFEIEKMTWEQSYAILNGDGTQPGVLQIIAGLFAANPSFVVGFTTVPVSTAEAAAMPAAEWEAYKTALTNLITHLGTSAPAELSMVVAILSENSIQEINNTPAIVADFDAELRNIEVREQAIDMVLTTLPTDIAAMQAAYAELESGKMSAMSEFTKQDVMLESGLAQMESAEQELEQTQEQLEQSQEDMDEARDNALKQADITGILNQDMVSSVLMAENFDMPAGYVEEGNFSYLVKVGEQYDSIEELMNTTIFYADIDGVGHVSLSDIATVEQTDNSQESYAKVNGNNAVILSFQKQSTFSTAAVSDEINKVMQDFEEENSGVNFAALMDQGDYIDMVINSVLTNLLYGGILAILVLALFLRDMRPTFVVACSIPFSLLCAVTAMYFSNITLNIISLSGLALGVGMLVDNSIVVIENIYRLRSDGVPVAKAAVEGAKQVSGAIFASTLTTVCVFLPIVFTTGLSRDLFMDMGLTIAYSLLASLFVALTLVPAMASTALKNRPSKQQKWFDKFVNAYSKVLSWCLRRKAPVLILVLVLLAFSLYSATQMGTAFVPPMHSPQMSATMTMPKGSSDADTFVMSDEVMGRISGIEGIDTVGAMFGSGGMMMMGTGSGESQVVQFYVLLEDGTSLTNAGAAQQMKDSVEGLDCTLDVTESSMDISALGGSGIQLMVKGQDLDEMADIAQELREVISQVEGIGEISQPFSSEEEIRIVVDKNAAMEYGLTVAGVYSEVSKALSESVDATILEMQEDDYPIVVMRSQSEMPDRQSIMDLPFEVTNAEGEESTILLSEIATRQEGQSVRSVSRENGSRYMMVDVSIAEGYNIGLVSRELEEKLATYEAPAGYDVEIQGENETIVSSLEDLLLVILLAVVFVYLIMVAQFQSLLSPFIVMFTIPLAFTGGLLALLFTGNDLSVVSMLGFLVLSGVVVNNGIVFVDTINQLRDEGMSRVDAILKTGKMRARPVLMTALTTILAMSTMALGIGQGAEMTQSLAIVTIGGLTYATLLTLLVIPILYDIMRKKDKKKIDLD